LLKRVSLLIRNKDLFTLGIAIILGIIVRKRAPIARTKALDGSRTELSYMSLCCSNQFLSLFSRSFSKLFVLANVHYFMRKKPVYKDNLVFKIKN